MTRLLFPAAAAALGLYAGSMLTEACVLVPYWRSLEAAEFHRWYAANDARLFTYFGRVTMLAAVLVAAAAAVAYWKGEARRAAWATAAALIASCIVMFPLYFESANAAFASAPLPADELAAELARWAQLHWVRTVLSALAFAVTLGALARGRSHPR